MSRLIDYYGVTFDHLVPADDDNPEVLQINIIEVEDDQGVYANTGLLFTVDPTEFIGRRYSQCRDVARRDGGHRIAGE